jgi:Reverse transcriptase (RNA-dependent DNA polymerase)
MNIGIPEQESIQNHWDRIQNSILKAAENVKKANYKGKLKDWFDDDCRRIIKLKNAARLKTINSNDNNESTDYRNIRKEAKRICRQKKRQYLGKLIENIETRFMNKEVRNFYQAVKKERSGFQPKPLYCKNSEGELVGHVEEKLKRWKEYFENTLNGGAENEENDGSKDNSSTQNGNNVEEVEVRRIIQHLKNNKSAGNNGITAELLKAGGEKLSTELYELIKRVWKTEQMPKEWSEAILIPLHKKEDITICENYRGIALLDTSYKVLANCIKNRLEPIVERLLGDYQCGFRANRSVTDQIFVLKQTIAKTYKHKGKLHIMFIDFKQAYDTIVRKMIFEAMKDFNIPPKLIALTKMILENASNRVKIEGRTSEPFQSKRGVRQGDPLSTILFNIVLEKILRKCKAYSNGTIYHHRHQILAYADDMVIITRTKSELIKVFKKLEQCAREMGLKINEGKTKYMMVEEGQENTKNSVLKVTTETGSEYAIERVSAFCYLGVTITDNDNETTEWKERVTKGNRSTGALQRIMSTKTVSRKAKLRIYETVIRPTVLYGSELWILSKKHVTELQIWERKILRKIFGGKQTSDGWRRRTNEELMSLYGKPSIVNVVKAQRIRWIGHIMRLPKDRATRKALDNEMGRRKRRGRPKDEWIKMVENDLQNLGVANWRKLATDRVAWKAVSKQALGLQGL